MAPIMDDARDPQALVVPADDRIALAEDPDTGDLFSLAAIGGGGFVVQHRHLGGRATWRSTAHVGHDQRTAIVDWLAATAPPVARRMSWMSEAALSACRDVHATRVPEVR